MVNEIGKGADELQIDAEEVLIFNHRSRPFSATTEKRMG